MEIIICARFVSLQSPSLIFSRDYEKVLDRKKKYSVEFLTLEPKILEKVRKENTKIDRHIEVGDNNKLCITIGTKLKGFLNLKPQTEYELKLTVCE